jgi:hypothetical protein
LAQQAPQTVAIIQKLDSMSVRELEMRVAQWREAFAQAENRVREFIPMMQRPGATPEMHQMLGRYKQDYEQTRFLYQKAYEILGRKHAQQQLQGQNAARMTPTNAGEPNRPGR